MPEQSLLDSIQQQIVALEHALADLPTGSPARAGLEAVLASMRSQIVALTPAHNVGGDDIDVGDISNSQNVAIGAGAIADSSTRGTVEISGDGKVYGPAVGVNLGKIIYGHDTEEDERRRLIWYLERLSSKLYRLPLRGIEERLNQGEGLALPQVYVVLATKKWISMPFSRASAVAHYFDALELPMRDISALRVAQPHHHDWALPPDVVVIEDVVWGNVYIARDSYEKQKAPQEQYWAAADGPVGDIAGRNLFIDCDDKDSEVYSVLNAPGDVIVNLLRPWLATEAVVHHQRLVLLGVPGSGKSTFVRHLAWALALRALDPSKSGAMLPGWDDTLHLCPIMVSLRTLSSRLAIDGISASTVTAALEQAMAEYDVPHIDDLLRGSLDRGAAIVFFDGLDEVPVEEIPHVTVGRQAVVQAIHDFAQLYAKPLLIITCRVRAFNKELEDVLNWPVETLASFNLGQVRHFVPAWYAELETKGQIDAAQRERLTKTLTDTIVASTRLQEMAETPLLLTMMALVVYNKGVLPRDRPQLYERIIELLLGQWDKVRDGQSLGDVIGRPDWGSERIRPLLDQLSYEAHRQANTKDGRGRLRREQLYLALIDFFKQAHLPNAGDAALRCLDYFDQRSGLLTPDENDSYVFAHLTFQEHCAGRALALSRDAAKLVLQYRVDDRWREPIFLGMGVAQATKPELIDRFLTDLIDRDENNCAKPVTRWYRDLILAAEIGRDRDWSYLRTQQVNVDRLERDLRRGLVILLGDRSQLLPANERVYAGVLLGELGDPRYPITIEQWREQLQRALAGDTNSYFCRVEAGEYIIGSSNEEPDAADVEKPQHTIKIAASFLIGRYLITVDQWQAWDEAVNQQRGTYRETGLKPGNAPVTAEGWHRYNMFCAWLTMQLVDLLPADRVLRLPTEYEWEAAARGGDARRYPWGDEWQDGVAGNWDDRKGLGIGTFSGPVGCYPAGSAPCGANDMVSDTWQWTQNVWMSYPSAAPPFADDSLRVVRGGGYPDRALGRCATRGKQFPTDRFNDEDGSGLGFRLVVAPSTEFPS